MNSKPLAYESLKCVLEHMDGTKRIQASISMPSIRTAEKAAPLRITNLQFKPYRFEANNDIYQIGIIRKCKEQDGKLLTIIEEWNERGGVKCDLDRFETEDKSFENTPFEGDLVVGNAKYREREVAGTIRGFEIQQMRLRSENESSPYTQYIRFSIKSENSEKVEYMEYNKKLHEAMKYLMQRVFGGRLRSIRVNRFSVNMANDTILRFVKETKMKIDRLKMEEDVTAVVNSLESIIDESSYPLKSVQMNINTHKLYKDAHLHPIVKESQVLIIRQRGFWKQSVPTNNKVFWKFGLIQYSIFTGIIESWLMNGGSIGSCHSFYINLCKFNLIQRFIEWTLQLPNAKNAELDGNKCEIFNTCISIPLNDTSEMNVFGEDNTCEETPCYLDIKPDMFVLKLRIMPIGTVQPI
ncbi:hypothetical protein GCK72_007122 [Caenorhabditis remanei]|uniref:Uncharacterized protein n=1 Tax=Caenorhabditis remanei TaxID=31234 RepID=A0A6A5HLA0_CAERE|nr:hypothetical protein GCK72_007122 [Caenorhabditis remanei]KAF1767163.1 hypothetical protein GCK72_007122 [Caenorhabditis remanei]